jgi:pimeloyl-ACP methyl ester carboxylesterase
MACSPGQSERPWPPAVFVHGHCCSSRHWAEARARLGEHTRLELLSLPGHDDVPLPSDRPLDIAACAEHVLRETAALHGPVLVGHSLGGMIGMQCLLDRPDAFSALVLVDAFPSLGMPEPFTRSYWEGSPPTLKARIVRQMMDRRKRLPATLWESIVAFDARPDLARLAAPVRGIYGDRGEVDHAVLAKSLREFGLGAIPDLEIHTVEQAGHFVMLEQPEAFYACLAGVLSRLP